jgi:sodium/bile acid cotransporter 7
MKARLKKHWFLLGMALVWALGFALPEASKAYQQSKVVDAAIALVMFCGALTLDTSHLLGQFRNARAVLLSFVMMYGIAPLIVFLASWPVPQVWNDSELARQLYVGFMLLAAQSCTLGSGIVVSTAARGNVALALVVTIFNSMLAAVMTPLILRLTLAVKVEFDVLAMIGRLSLIILLPVVLGQLVRPLVRATIERVRWLPAVLSQLAILSFIFMTVGTAADWMASRPWVVLGVLLATFLLHAIILAANFALSPLGARDIASRRSLAICSSQKTVATGSYIWSKYFPDNPVGGVPLVFYHVVQLVFDSLLAHWLAQRDTRAVPPTLETLGEAEERQA